MLVLSSVIALSYYNCCTDGSNSPGNYGYTLVKNFVFRKDGSSFKNVSNMTIKTEYDYEYIYITSKKFITNSMLFTTLV
jgi:hypothetical protein